MYIIDKSPYLKDVPLWIPQLGGISVTTLIILNCVEDLGIFNKKENEVKENG